MKLNWCKLAIMALALGVFTACSEDDEPNGEGPGTETGGGDDTTGGSGDNTGGEPVVSLGAYVLNTGNWGGNDAGIQFLDFQTGELSEDLYAAANGEGLGDLGQDLCVYGSKIYVTVSGSSKVVIMDRKCKVLKSIPVATEDGTPVEPRYMAACEGKVYFTAYDGTVSRIDTTSMAIDGKLNLIDAGAQTGYDHPEAITSANRKLCVNISGYSKGKWLAVVDAASFTKLKDIEVMLNPYTQCITAEDGYVYFVSNGNYAGSPSLTPDQYVYGTMQRLDPETDQVEQVCRGQPWLAVFVKFDVRALQVAVSSDQLLGFGIPYDQLLVGMLHDVVFIEVERLARSSPGHAERYLAQPSDLTHHVRRVLIRDYVDFIVALVCETKPFVFS